MGDKTGEYWTNHAVERAASRYPGLTEDDFRELVTTICDRAGGLLMKRSIRDDPNSGGYLVQHKGRRIAVVVDIGKRLIITFLPPDYFSAGSMEARKKWRSRTKRKIPDDFGKRKGKARAGPLEMG